MNMIRKWGFILIVLLSITSCSNYSKIVKGTDYTKKYELALQLYNKKDYNRAYPLLEELVSVYRGTVNAEDIYYYYSYCNYYMDDLISAGYHFSQFVKTYPGSLRAEEVAFMNAYCYYLGSPNYTLDQTNSIKAIEEMQLFINQYPNSTRIAECNDLIDQLRLKLENKSVDIGKLFYKTMDYKAAIVSFKNTLKDFPNTVYKEEIMFLTIKASFLLAENSIDSKKFERYKNTVDAYYSFIDKFATGKYAREAESIFVKANEQFNILKPKS
jgi:outer membrane protein assembly factor BamD